MKKIVLILLALLLATILTAASNVNIGTAVIPDVPTLDPLSIPKYVDQLVIPPVYVPTYVVEGGRLIQTYQVDMTEFYQQILPTTDASGNPTGFAPTKVWGYGGNAKDPLTGQLLGYFRNSPASTFEAIRGIPVKVTWTNNIVTPHLFPVDPTLHWANPNNMPMMPPTPWPEYPPGFPTAQSPVPLVPHLHGGELLSDFDGGPEQWFTATGLKGADYRTLEPTAPNAAVYYYPNDQMPTTLWYHDHALGMTRINVMSGLAGFYLLRDNNNRDGFERSLPRGKYEIPIAIQDRSFNTDGSMWFPTVGANPDIHPYWQPEFFGNTIMVNGKLWPNLNVDRGQYRFRILDGSNARFYELSLDIIGSDEELEFTQIGTEGGFLESAVNLETVIISPGERADVLIDFSKLRPGTKVIMRNAAAAPYPNGDPVDPNTTGQIMQFTVTNARGFKGRHLPEVLNPTLRNGSPSLVSNSPRRILPFFEQMSAIDEPIAVFLNGQKWAGVLTETPRVGATEDWWLVNPTEDAHPIHTHLTQFQVVYRIPFNAVAYTNDWIALNGAPPLPEAQAPTTLAVEPYLTGPPEAPALTERGWKDTVRTPPGYITVIRIRWAPQNAPVTGPRAPTPGVNLYSFNPTTGPGYVWHCHIVDHEDNEMMRRYMVTP
jgi:FtsP/CotA-like multicopper oxidase with cupredoxin domain